MPHAPPPRWLLVASGAPNSAMMMHVTGTAIFNARSTRERFASPPERSMAVMNFVISAYRMLCGSGALVIISAGVAVNCLSRADANEVVRAAPVSPMIVRLPRPSDQLAVFFEYRAVSVVIRYVG